MISRRSFISGSKKSGGSRWQADDGGSAHAALRFTYTGSGDSRVAKETTAEAHMPLCPPTPSLGHEQVNESGRVELLAAVHGYRRMVRRKVPPFVQAQGVHFFFFPRPAFSTVCALSSLTGRRLKGHVREGRRLGSGEGGGRRCFVDDRGDVVVFWELV